MTESTNTVHVGVPNAQAEGFDVRLVKVETAVTGLYAALGDIKTGVEKITTQVSSKGQINWAALALLAMVLVPSLGWAWSRIEGLQDRLEKSTANFVSRDDIKDKFDSAKEVADLKAQISAKDAQIVAGKVERLATDVADVQSKIVPLSTHQELWASQHEANKALAAQIDENRRALADITAPKETISRFDKRLDALEAARGRGHE